jgi:hypothetical protein
MSTTVSPRSSAGIARWGALGGVVFVIVFAIGVVLTYDGPPDTDSAPAKLIAYYSDSGHRDKINVGTVIMALGLFAFIWFLAALRRTVSRLEGEDGFLTTATTIGGGIYVSLTLASIAVNDGIKTMSDDTYRHQVFPGLIHAADDAAWLLHASGGIGAATMVLAATIAAMRARAVATWLGWLGIVAGILTIALVTFFPWFVLAIWILVVSIGMFVRGGRTTVAVAPA